MPLGMPKVAVNKDSDMAASDGNVRRTRKFLIVLPIPQATVLECLSQKDFWFGVLAVDMAHNLMDLLF